MTKQDSFYDLYQEQLRVSANLSKQLKEALSFQEFIPEGMRKGDVVSLIKNNKQLRENNKRYQKVNQELKQALSDTLLKKLGIYLTCILDDDEGYPTPHMVMPDKILDAQAIINWIPTGDVPKLLLGYISAIDYDNLKATLLPLDPPFELSLDKLIKAIKEYKEPRD